MSWSPEKIPPDIALMFNASVVHFRSRRVVCVGGQNGRFAILLQREDAALKAAALDNVIKVTLPEDGLVKLISDLQGLLAAATLRDTEGNA